MALKSGKSDIEKLKTKLKESELKFKSYCKEVAAQNEEFKAINKKYLKLNEELSEKNATIIKIMNEFRYNEAKSRQMFLTSPVGIFYYDNNLIINEHNFAFSEILSAPSNLLKGFDMHNITYKNVVPAIVEATNGKIGHYEGKYISVISGKEVFVDLNTYPIYSREDSTKIIGGVGFAQDLTKWKTTHDKLEESSENLRLTLESIGEGVVVTNCKTEIANINSVALKLLNLTNKQVIGRLLSDIFLFYKLNTEEQIKCPSQIAINNDKTISFNNIELKTKNNIYNVSFNIAPIRKANGEIMGSIMVIQDITKQIEIQNEIINSENKFRALFENSPTGIALIDTNGNILEINNILVKLLGSPSAQATKKINVLQFKPLVDIGLVEDFNLCLSSLKNVQRTTKYVSYWGNTIYVQYVVSPLLEPTRKTKKVILNIIDITAQKIAEEKEKVQLKNIEFITRATLDLIELPATTDPLYFIGERLKSIVGDNTVIINKYKDNKFNIEYIFSTNEKASQFSELFNQHHSKITLNKVDNYHNFNYTKKIIELNPYDFFTKVFNLPIEVIKMIIEKHKVNKIYFMGVCSDSELLANITIITYNNSTIQNHEVIESFVNQVSLLIKSKLVQQSLSYAEKLYNNTLNSISEMIFVTDTNSRILFANSSLKKLIKNSNLNDKIEGTKLNVAIPFLNQSIYDTFNKVLNNKTAYFTEEINKVNEQNIFTQTIITPVLEGNNVVRIITSMRDITLAKQSEIEIESLREINESIINNMNQGILMEDENGLVVMVNSAFCKMFSIEIDEIIGKQATFMIPEPLHNKIHEFKKNIINQNLSNTEIEFHTKNGNMVTAIHNTFPILKNGDIKNIVCVFTDISERKKIENELIIEKEKAEESDKLKSAFLANMSHELRTPINGIIGFSNMLNKNDVESEKRNKYISQINSNSQLLLRLIDDIIDVAKIESGKLTIEKSTCSLNDLMEDLLLHYKHELKTLNKINLHVNLEKPINNEISIITDPLRLKQILINLLSNAIKFTSEGLVKFGYSLKENEILFFVSDTGIGMKPENISKIFERFVQVEQSISRKVGGTGLGLTISKNIVELLGGKIWVESEFGKGSTFYFTIPYEQANTNKNNVQITYNLSNKTVLIAEDDDLNYMFIEEMLSETNLKLIRATNGLECLEVVKSNDNIDLILMDLQMPIMDGYECVKQVLNIKPNMLIIAQTAFSITAEKEKSMKLGCVDYICKPINFEELIYKINKYINA